MTKKLTTKKRTARKSRLTRPRQAMPAWVRRELTARGLTSAYRSRPAYQQNDYLLWITSAKLESTQKKRASTMLEELATGKRYMNMAWRQPRNNG